MELSGVSALHAAAPKESAAAPNESDPLLPLLKIWKGASMICTHLNISCHLRQFFQVPSSGKHLGSTTTLLCWMGVFGRKTTSAVSCKTEKTECYWL